MTRLIAGYLESLKPLDVEEPVDVWLHRPLAYLMAWLASFTPITPNFITVCSIVLGAWAGVLMFVPEPRPLPLAGLLIFLSAVLDCADGQLARMKKTTSAFGRMLDGLADLVVSISLASGATWLIWHKYAHPTWHGAIVLGLVAATLVTTSFHTTSYEHYKYAFVRLTHPTYRDGEDRATALRRFEETKPEHGVIDRVVWRLYLHFSGQQFEFLAKFDPATNLEYSKYPEYSAHTERIYRRYAGGLMRLWRTWFGFGSLVFGLALAVALGVPEYYLVFRLVGLNAFFWLYMRPAQRRASARAFRELAAL